jgi:hypothetical protein
VKDFVTQWRATGSIAPKPATKGKAFLMTAAGEAMLRDRLANPLLAELMESQL